MNEAKSSGDPPSQKTAADVPDTLRQASELHRQGRLEEAENLYRNVLALSPDQADALHFLGVIEAQRGRHREAAALIARAAAIAPGNPAIHYNQGNVLRAAGRLEDALQSYDRALALAPDNPAMLNNRGAILHELKRPLDALASYDEALRIDPNHAPAHLNRGNALLGLGRHQEALASYASALALQPQHPGALFGRGRALLGLERREEALTDFNRVVSIDPLHAEAHANRGDVLFQLNRLAEALSAYDRAIAIKPDLAAAHQGRGNTLFKLGRGGEACAAYDKAFHLDPSMEAIEGTRLLTKMYVCDWANIATEREHLRARVLAGELAANPFAFLMVGETPAEQLLCARAYAAAKYPPTPLQVRRGERWRHGRIRLAYVSGEFREQATAYLAADLFECHDRNEFELYGLSTGLDDRSPMRKRIATAFDVFSDVSREPDRTIAERIGRAEIDILVNLNGFFGEARTGVVAFKPAPIQVSYLGFPGTMGAPYMDYILADRWIIPEDEQPNYTEKVVYLPHSYQANDRKKAIGAKGARAGYGLPEEGFVYCSFNNAYKITPEVFSIWMRLLERVEGSVLWLLQVDPGVERNLRREAQARGIAPERIVFAPFVKLKEHLARGQAADLFLDTLPVNAHTTASDALWMGVPVLTCLGATFAGRVAGSLLAAVGLPELITRSLSDYEALALKLAHDPDLLGGIRARLARNRETAPLFDTPRLTRHIESAYKEMWQRHQRGLPPEGFAVG